jgi:DNA repair protein RecO (recombination protein O)
VQLKQSRGIILRSIKYSETSLILDIYSLDYGLRSYIISGVRKSKTKSHASALQILNMVAFTAYPAESDKLSRIKEFNIYHKYENLTYEVIKTSVGIFLIELIRNSIREREENNSLYEFIEKKFIELDKIATQELTTFYLGFVLSFTEYLGFYPLKNYEGDKKIFDLMNGKFVEENENSRYTLNIQQSRLLSMLLYNHENLVFNKPEREDLLNNLLKYYLLHIPDFKALKSLDVLKEIMS